MKRLSYDNDYDLHQTNSFRYERWVLKVLLRSELCTKRRRRKAARRKWHNLLIKEICQEMNKMECLSLKVLSRTAGEQHSADWQQQLLPTEARTSRVPK